MTASRFFIGGWRLADIALRASFLPIGRGEYIRARARARELIVEGEAS